MRSRYLCTSSSEVMRWVRRACWSSETVASTSCRRGGASGAGWAARGDARTESDTTKRDVRFMVSPSLSEKSIIRPGRGWSQRLFSRSRLPGEGLVDAPEGALRGRLQRLRLGLVVHREPVADVELVALALQLDEEQGVAELGDAQAQPLALDQ